MTAVDMPAGTYRPCLTCSGPVVVPFPGDWTLDLIKEGPRDGPAITVYTPHSPDCTAPIPNPQPGIALRFSGRDVTNVEIDITAHPDGPLGAEHRETVRTTYDPETLVATAGKVWFAPIDEAPPLIGARWFDPPDSGWTYLGEATDFQFGNAE